MFAAKTLLLAFAAFAAAQLHAPVGDKPEGNPISRPVNEAVVAGTPFTITWAPTDASHTISILLLKGPSTNVVKVGAPIAEGIPNSGSYTWTPPADFGPGDSETTGYGIQIIDDVNGKYQYSTQFGITIPEGYASSSSAAVPTSTKAEYDSYPTASASKSASLSHSSVAQSSSVAANTSTIAYPTKIVTSAPIVSTGYPAGNGTTVRPTGSMTVPSSLLTTATPSATTSGVPESTGAASHLQAGLGLAAGVAGLFFML
jgi:hypothetical protein